MIGNELFVTAFIADIHFGALKSELLFQQLEERFLKKIDKKRIDMIVFGGDMFHSIITMNYSTSHYVLMFMERVIELAVRNNIKYIRIIQGTMSHDNNQLNNFHIFENRTDVDFKIIHTVQREELSEGIKILYVPEEYLSDPNEYYEDYINPKTKKEYDFIFGHGMFKEVSFTAKNQESEVTMSKAPVFDSKMFINACKGPVYFGHIHIKTTIREHIHYPGSFSRFKHGEEEDKGWYINIYNKNTHKYVHEFIVNNLAQEYVTITCKMDDKITPESLSAVIENVLKSADFVKCKIIIDDDTDCSYLLAYMNEKYQKSQRVKLDIKNNYEFKQELKVDKAIDEVYNKYDFLFDKGLSHEDKIQKFIKVKNDKDIPIDVIKDMLNLN